MVHYQCVATPQDDGSEYVQLFQQSSGGLFRRAKSATIPFQQWTRYAPKSSLVALATARALDTHDEIIEDENGVKIPSIIVARLQDADAHNLGLPPATSLTLQLDSTGSLHKGTIDVQAKWIRRGGQPVFTRVSGARVEESEHIGRIVEPLYSVYRAALLINAADSGDKKRAAFADLRLALGDNLTANIKADGFIEKMRIAYAAHFSLDVKTSKGQFDFNPVLFSRHIKENEDDDLIDESESSLLTPHETVYFQQKFRRQKDEKRSYLLQDGTLLFVDEFLGKALDVVKEKQTAPNEERRIFIQSPQRIIREALQLDDRDDDELADRLFIETSQFSERVKGIDVWEKPVTPWIKPSGNSWLPEKFGLRVGEPPKDKYIEMQAGDAIELKEKMETASQLKEDVVPWKGEDIPVTPASVKAVNALAQLESEVKAEHDNEAPLTEETALEDYNLNTVYFLRVDENFMQVDYARLPRSEDRQAEFTPPSFPQNMTSTPKEHQKHAFAWLCEAWSKKMPGVLLADDMGLGKTFEALSFLAWLNERPESDIGPILIVAPTALLKNWQEEIKSHLKPRALGAIIEAYGKNLKQYRTGRGNDIRGGTSRLNFDIWDKNSVILTTYETMRDYHMSFARMRFSVIIYDEIQKLKNPASQMTRAAKSLNADIQIALTGTPVENKMHDLWSITDTVYPGFLGSSRDFTQNYTSDDQGNLKALQDRLIKRDSDLPPFMLRRMKEDILDSLPEKHIRVHKIAMPVVQAEAYNQILARASVLKENGSKGAMLKILHNMRGVSLHPQPPHGIDDIPQYIAQSARLTKTFALLKEIQGQGEKALIFCESRDMQSFLSMAIQDVFQLDYAPSIINGAMAGSKRQTIVNQFQSSGKDFDVMILSPKAAGVGLTITKANHVIHLSRWWNPAVEDQATDRVYRIGQKKTVTVHLPLAMHPDSTITESSFDLKLHQLMEKKRVMSRDLLMPMENDDDTEYLLDQILYGDSRDDTISHDNGDQEAAKETPAADKKTATAKPEKREILSAKISPAEFAEKQSKNVTRVVYKVNGTRDLQIFYQYLKDIAIESLEINDPYCCANIYNTGYLLNFVDRIRNASASLKEVSVKALDADSLDSYDYHSIKLQRGDVEQRWNNFLSDIELKLILISKRRNGDFHDRHIHAVCENGAEYIWDLGRGVEGVMNPKRECTVNAHQIN